jgi:LysR family transcriptional regulator, positive regulator for ilvC
MDIAKLRLFAQLAETRHFGRAAQLCHMSPSAASRNLKQLEEALGARLLERDNRSVGLTPEGESFLVFAREMLQQWEDIQGSLAIQTGELRGQLSIYCSVTASYSFLFDILADFRGHHPGIGIKLHTGDPAQAIARVIAGQEDIAIAARPEQLPQGLGFKPIARSPQTFITPKHQVFGSPELAIDDPRLWEQIPLILSEEGIGREQLDRWFRDRGIRPQIYAEVKGNEAIVSMVSLGFGVGVVPQIVVDNSPLADRVMPFYHQPDLGPFDTGLCVLEKRLRNPIVAAFWAQIPQT